MLLTVDLLTFWVFGHQAATPLRHPFWLGLKRRLDNGLDLVWPKGGLASSARRNFPQAVDTLLPKAPSPQHDGLSIDRQLLSDGTVGSTGGRGQHDPAAQGHLLGSSV